MPNGWKKNAKYFNHLEMSHSAYMKKKRNLVNGRKKWRERMENHL